MKENIAKGGPGPPSSLISPSPFSPPSSPGSLLVFTMQPTLVSLRKSKTAFAALSFHRCLTDEAFGCFYDLLACLPDRLPHIGLKGPCSTLSEEMVTGLFLSSLALVRRQWGGREGSLWVAAGDTGRGWESESKLYLKLPPVALGLPALPLPWPFGPHVAGYK